MAKVSITKKGSKSDQYFSNVSLLLPFNTNFQDSSLNNLAITSIGDVQISSLQSKFGTGSAYFDGNGDYLQTAIPNWNPGVNGEPFTIELWIYKLGTWGLNVFLSKHGGVNAWNGTDGLNFNFYYTGSILYFQNWGSNTTQTTSCNIALPTDQWVHLAVVYDGANTTIYVDGSSCATSSASYDNTTLAPIFEIGSQINGGYNFNGYIDDLRITKGIARYTSNFIPEEISTSKFGKLRISPILNVLKLGKIKIKKLIRNIPQDSLVAFWELSDLLDSSINGNNLANAGNVQFVSGKLGNCAQFNQTNYLQNSSLVPAFNPNGPNGEFTISCWVNPTSFSNYQAFLGSVTDSFIIHTDGNGTLYCNEARGGDAQINGILQLNQWQHIVFVKSVALGNRTKVWYNGVKVYDQPTNNNGNYQSRTNITLGNYTAGISGYSFPYNGKLDMVGLWNKELTEQEIAMLYNDGNG